jgi:hypothetical protein
VPSLLMMAVISGRTAHKLPVKISALSARFIVAHMVKECEAQDVTHAREIWSVVLHLDSASL